MDLFLLAGTNRRKTVNLIEENDTGLSSARFLEEQSKLFLGFTHPLAQGIGTLTHVE